MTVTSDLLRFADRLAVFVGDAEAHLTTSPEVDRTYIKNLLDDLGGLAEQIRHTATRADCPLCPDQPTTSCDTGRVIEYPAADVDDFGGVIRFNKS